MSYKAYLALDTSTDRASFALKKGDEVYIAAQEGVATHAEKCLAHIHALLTQAKLSISDLAGIVVGRGPGSFTGLRVACAVVKGLAYGQAIPVYPVRNLQLLAWQTQEKSSVLAVMDARMQQVYWAYYPDVLAHAPEFVTAISEIKVPNHTQVVLAGFNLEKERQQLPQEINLVKEFDLKPQALDMIHMVEQGLIQPISAEALEPTYVRDQVTHGSSNG